MPVGTTGESPTVDYEEHIRIIELSVKFAAGRIKVLAGTGGNSTSEAIYLTEHAEKAGADGSLAGRALLQQADAGGALPALPRGGAPARGCPSCSTASRAGAASRLAWTRSSAWRRQCKNIIGIKEAGGNADRVSQLRAALGPRFEIMSGDDSLTLPFMAVGAQGVISVASNVIPRQVAQMVEAYAAGKTRAALKLHQKYYPLFKDLFIETNPVPVKAALAMLGQIEEEYRLPLVPMSAKNREVLRATMKAVGVLK